MLMIRYLSPRCWEVLVIFTSFPWNHKLIWKINSFAAFGIPNLEKENTSRAHSKKYLCIQILHWTVMSLTNWLYSRFLILKKSAAAALTRRPWRLAGWAQRARASATSAQSRIQASAQSQCSGLSASSTRSVPATGSGANAPDSIRSNRFSLSFSFCRLVNPAHFRDLTDPFYY